MYTPKSDRAEWRILYDALRELAPGEVITYQQLSALLGRDFRASRGPMTQARKHLERTDRRTLVNQAGSGYRIAACGQPGHASAAGDQAASGRSAQPARKAFEPKGEQAEWRIVYDALRKLAPGEVITYQQLSALLGRDILAGRDPVLRAMKELEHAGQRTLANVRGTGYRIAAAHEHEQLARAHSTRSRRQLVKAVSRARSANRAELTHDQARRLDDLETQLTQHAGLLRRLDVRDRERETQLQQLRRDTNGDIAGLSSQLDHLTGVLRRHGIEVPAAAPALHASEPGN